MNFIVKTFPSRTRNRVVFASFLVGFVNIIIQALGSTPTSGRAVQQKVEGRFNDGMHFFDRRHSQWWENIALLDAAAASMTG